MLRKRLEALLLSTTYEWGWAVEHMESHALFRRSDCFLKDTVVFQAGNFLCVLFICFGVKTGSLVFCAPRVPISPVVLSVVIFSMHSQPELLIITSWLALRRILPPTPSFYFFSPSLLSLLGENQELPWTEKHWLLLSLWSHGTNYTATGDYAHLEKRLNGVGLLRLAGRWVRGYVTEI